ncbi:uroporphyrinogen-III synthase [Bordetella petrii]|uniref:uroporphyrinogen-III synthase n=1 Tax=Bordetella petrii TaxID=94624 RepID=UPI0037318F4E
MLPIAILTRPDGRNAPLERGLHDAGWQTLALPALEIQPLPADAAGPPLPQDHDLVVFVSGNAARLYLAQLHAAGMPDWPGGTLAATVGPASARAFRACPGVGPDAAVLYPPPEAAAHDSEALWQVLRARGALPRRVLLVRGTSGRDWLGDQLEAAGVQVARHAVYRRLPALWPASAVRQLREWAGQGRPATWLLTSGEGIDAVRAQVDAAGIAAWWRASRFVVTHPSLVPRLGLAGSGQGPAPMVKICLPADEAILAAFVAA